MYELKERIRYSETDNKGRLTLPALINLLQDTAIMHSEDIDRGIKYLWDRHQGWFVTAYSINIESLPKLGTPIIVKTYPYNFKGCVGLRGYQLVENESSTPIISVNSTWALINLDTYGPAKIDEEMQSAYAPYDVPENLPENKKLKAADGHQTTGSFKVTESYIDTNNHMNNAVYVELMSAYLPMGFVPKQVNIAYKKALFLGDTANVTVSAISPDCLQIAFWKENELSCLAEFIK